MILGLQFWCIWRNLPRMRLISDSMTFLLIRIQKRKKEKEKKKGLAVNVKSGFSFQCWSIEWKQSLFSLSLSPKFSFLQLSLIICWVILILLIWCSKEILNIYTSNIDLGFELLYLQHIIQTCFKSWSQVELECNQLSV